MSKTRQGRLAITLGDPAGVGPEVVVKALGERLNRAGESFIVVGALGVMEEAVARYGNRAMKKAWAICPRLQSPEDLAETEAPLAFLSVSDLTFTELRPGRPGKKEGEVVAASLSVGFSLWERGVCQGLVTAPVTKSALLLAGFKHAGHTGWLAEKCGRPAVMMLVAGRLRVVPVTVHLPLAEVPVALTTSLLVETIRIVDRDLKFRFRIKKPRLAVAGLNPHAGEEGVLGQEEREVIFPALERARKEGVLVRGPFPADTLFTRERRREYDVALCMFHDQALIPIKALAFHSTVNVTLGLPMIRTSPGHGSALDIAWQGIADHRSMAAAIALAWKLSRKPSSCPPT